MINGHITKVYPHVESNGKRSIRHVYTNADGDVFQGEWEEVANGIDYNADAISKYSKIQTKIENDEVFEFLTKLKNGDNPFRNKSNDLINPKRQTRNSAIKKVLKFIGNLPPKEVIKYKDGLQFLSKLNQTQIEASGFNYQKYQLWVARSAALESAYNLHSKIE